MAFATSTQRTSSQLSAYINGIFAGAALFAFAWLGHGTSYAAGSPGDSTKLDLIPWPKSVQSVPGVLSLGQKSRIVYADGKLAPLASVLAGEIQQLTGTALETAAGKPAAGDISLEFDPGLKGESYTLTVADTAVVRGSNYTAVALGTVTLLQTITGEGGKLAVPRMTVEDQPSVDYRGLHIDVARQWNPPEVLEQLVILCRFYKIKYFHIHFNDSGSYTFPSKHYPKLNEGMHYTMEQMLRLQKLAEERGIIIVPELEGPGHSNMLQHAYPLIFGMTDNVLRMSNHYAYDALDTLVGEFCEVFTTTPYIHVGADEAWHQGCGGVWDYKDFCKRHNLGDTYDLYCYYIVMMNEIVKKHGKRTILWEGFHGDGSGNVKIPKDIIITEFEVSYNLPDNLVGMGYDVINTSWTPLYVLGPSGGRSAEDIYRWNMYQFKRYGAAWFDQGVQLHPTKKVLGAQMCSWEQPGGVQVISLRPRLPAMSERIWNPDAGKTYADFARRLQAVDDRIVPRLVILPAGIKKTGLVDPGDTRFRPPLTIAMEPVIKGTTIRYTLDGREVQATNSTSYAGPIRIESSSTFRARVFDGQGQPVGYEFAENYELDPIEVSARGLATEKDPRANVNSFRDKLILTMQSHTPGTIRYTLDNKEPAGDSPQYKTPIVLDTTTVVRARLFDEKNAPVAARQFGCWYGFQPVEMSVKGLSPEQDKVFADELTVALRSEAKGTIRYTLDGKEPTKDSSAYGDPIRLRDSATMKARLFDDSGAVRGQETSASYECVPLTMSAETPPPDPGCPPPVVPADGGDIRIFCKYMKITLKASPSGGQIRYSLDGEALASADEGKPYTGPITVTRPAYFTARYFDKDGKARGKTLGGCYYTYEKTLTTDKPVTASSQQGTCGPEFVVDGCTYHEQPWMAMPGPGNWLQVDLEKVCKVNKVHVFTYWTRQYKYTVDVSTDGSTWVKVAEHDGPSNAEGDVFKFDPTPARFIRINNAGLLIELKAYGEAQK